MKTIKEIENEWKKFNSLNIFAYMWLFVFYSFVLEMNVRLFRKIAKSIRFIKENQFWFNTFILVASQLQNVQK